MAAKRAEGSQARMMHEYVFQPPQRVLSGPGSVKKVAAQLEKLGKDRALILTGNTLATKTDEAPVEQMPT